MLFSTIEFVCFMLLLFFLYWKVFSAKLTLQNLFLFAASIYFYWWIDWRLPLLLMGSVLLNYGLALAIDSAKKESHERVYFWIGILINIGLLGVFKYLNFFYESIVDLVNALGGELTFTTVVIIPFVGISFFTFQAIGYLIDVYYGNIEPYKKVVSFSTYMVYFPKLLSGPIERAQNLIPQLEKERKFDYTLAAEGCKQILWGMVAKIFIADNLNQFIAPILENHANEQASTLLLCCLLYIIQLYCDFSGYSNMAIGLSKLLGIKLSRNFKFPLFSVNVSDFWRRWHMSLTTWMMDYLFTPLSFLLRKKNYGLVLSISVTFMTVGLWHGANWTYVVFGLTQSALFIPLALKGNVNSKELIDDSVKIPPLKVLVRMLGMFVLMAFCFSLLVMKDLGQWADIYQRFVSLEVVSIPDKRPSILILGIIIFLLIEWFTRSEEVPLYALKERTPRVLRWGVYYALILLIFFFGGEEQQFIYFQY